MSDSARVKEILQQIAVERSKGVRQGRIFGLVLLGMFALTAGSIYWRITHFDTAKLQASIEREASARVWPLVSKEMDRIAADAVPALTAALAAEAVNFMPNVSEKLAGESVLFHDHVHKKMTSALDTAFARAVSEQGDAMKGRFPQFASNPERYDALMLKLNARCQQWAQAQLDTTFAEHIVVLQSINTSVQTLSLQAAANANDPNGGGARSMEDVMTLLLEIMNTRLEGKG
ncbi:MAG: hypothetical protein EXR69_01485 [Myxococcales bacterium]|nr:hypothetical protein [Myxococcales bacterium]